MVLTLDNEALSALTGRDTDRPLARYVGAILHEAGAGSEDIVDAHVVAVAAEAGGGLLLTSDPADRERRSVPYRTIVIEPLAQVGVRRR